LHVAFLYLLLASTAAAPDTLVICPTQFRSALAPWEQFRHQQGHRIVVVPPSGTAEEVTSVIRRVAQSGELKYLLLIGDVPDKCADAQVKRAAVPTNYALARVNTRWRSEPTIATDVPYADVDGDNRPDLAVGRIPADSAEELAAVVRKIMRYEQPGYGESGQQRLHVVAGVGGFGALADTLVEAAARQVFRQTVPEECQVQQLTVNPADPHCPPPSELAASIRRQLGEEALAWIYLGHGWPTELDRVRTALGEEPILSVADVPRIRCRSRSPLAVLVACYTGAFDSRPDCLAEELLVAEHGPIAVIAATRVTMPYGNTILGYELLSACFKDRPEGLGDVLLLAQRRTLDNLASDSLRTSLDTIALGLSPQPVDLAAERREHVQMYHLFGDPLTRIQWQATGDGAPSDSRLTTAK
jgi:hypothetical protein